jgi:hypothetical protein
MPATRRGVWKVPLASRYPSRALKETPNRATAAGPANVGIPTKKAVTRLMRASLVRSLFNKRYTGGPPDCIFVDPRLTRRH